MPSSYAGVRVAQLNRRTASTHRKILAVGLSMGLLASCSRNDPAISARLATLVRDSNNVVVDLATLDGPEWQRVCFLPPYTSTAATPRILGFAWDSDRHTSIRRNDSIAVVVLVAQQEVVGFSEHPRNLGDVANVGANCLERADARLTRKVDATGWVRLVREQGLQSQHRRSSTSSRASDQSPRETSSSSIRSETQLRLPFRK